MENKDSLDKVDIKKDRGDNLKRVVKPKVPKKEIIKDLVEDRGDSVAKPVKEEVINAKNTKPIETSNKNLEKNAKDFVTAKINKKNSKSKESKEDSKKFDKTVPARLRVKQNEEKSKTSDKSAPANLITDPINKQTDKIHTKQNKRSNYKQNVPSNLEKPINLDTNLISKPTKDKVVHKNDAHVKDLSSNIDRTAPGNKNHIKASLQNSKNIVESNKHVNRQLDIEEKKRIRNKYTFKPRATVKNKLLDDKSNDVKDSQVEDKNDILMKPMDNEVKIKEKAIEYRKPENTKINKDLDGKEKSKKRPIIQTIVAKNDVTKIYKAVTFTEQKRKLNTPLQINIPVCLRNTNIPNDTATTNITNDDNEKGDMRNLKSSQSDDDNLPRDNNKKKISHTDKHFLKTPVISRLLENNIDSLMLNVQDPMSPLPEKGTVDKKKKKTTPNDDNLSKNIKISANAVTGNTKVRSNVSSKNKKNQKPQNTGDHLKKKPKIGKLSQSSDSRSRSSAKTRFSKMEKRSRLNGQLSLFSLATGNGSPPTEVAKWAPNSINKHTQPYYEAWVDTTLAAISRKPKKDRFCEHRNLINSFKNILQERNESPELMYENYLDERYTGKIKINHRQ